MNHIARNHIRSGLRGNTVPAVRDVSHSQVRQRSRPPRHHPRLSSHTAFRADEPFRPTQPLDVLPATGIATKPFVHFLERPGVIDSWDGAPDILHRLIVSPSPAGVKGIPICRNIRAPTIQAICASISNSPT